MDITSKDVYKDGIFIHTLPPTPNLSLFRNYKSEYRTTVQWTGNLSDLFLDKVFGLNAKQYMGTPQLIIRRSTC